MPDKLIRNAGSYILGAGIALVVLVVGVTIEFYFPHLASFFGTNLRWVHLAYYSTVVFGLLLSYFRNLWASVTFWELFALALIAHITLFVLYLNDVGSLSSIYFMIIGPPELVVVGLLIERGVPKMRKGYRGHRA